MAVTDATATPDRVDRMLTRLATIWACALLTCAGALLVERNPSTLREMTEWLALAVLVSPVPILVVVRRRRIAASARRLTDEDAQGANARGRHCPLAASLDPGPVRGVAGSSREVRAASASPESQHRVRALSPLADRVRKGEATAISIFLPGDRRNWLAQHKVLSSWVGGSNVRLDLFPLTPVLPGEPLLLVMIGSTEAQWAFSRAVKSGGVSAVMAAVLSEEERQFVSPVSCHESFPQPGFALGPRASLSNFVQAFDAGQYEIAPGGTLDA
jgi:hypothetical protein